MRLTTLAMFGAGCVVAAKAGRERYQQIVAAAEKTSKRSTSSARAHRLESSDGGRDPGRREQSFLTD